MPGSNGAPRSLQHKRRNVVAGGRGCTMTKIQAYISLMQTRGCKHSKAYVLAICWSLYKYRGVRKLPSKSSPQPECVLFSRRDAFRNWCFIGHYYSGNSCCGKDKLHQKKTRKCMLCRVKVRPARPLFLATKMVLPLCILFEHKCPGIGLDQCPTNIR